MGSADLGVFVSLEKSPLCPLTIVTALSFSRPLLISDRILSNTNFIPILLIALF